METTKYWFLILFLLVSCGSGNPTPPPLLSEAVTTKTVFFEPNWPEALKTQNSELILQATLKGVDAQAKQLGALGPVAGEKEGSRYRFIFAKVPDALDDPSELTVDILWPSETLSTPCRLIAKISGALDFETEETNFASAPEEFSFSHDCDGDGLNNLTEFLLGLRVDASDSDGDGIKDGEDLFPLDNTESYDQDQDGIGDNRDDCPSVANGEQRDLDGDGLGDDCDPDVDNDGLLNTFEQSLGLDPFQIDSDSDGLSDGSDNCYLQSNPDQADIDNDTIGNVCDIDRDGDERLNGEDNCPELSNPGQENGDGDPFGDSCDCAPLEGRKYQTSADPPDRENFDSNCDGVDGDAAQALFVSANRGSDENLGTVVAPFRTFAKAYSEALSQSKDVTLEDGSYDLTGVIFSRGVRIFGGYRTDTESQPFSHHCVYPATCAESVLDFGEVGTFLLIDNAQGPFLFHGLRLDTPVVIQNSAVTFQNSRLPTLTLEGEQAITLENNLITGEDSEESSVGVLIDGADEVLLRQNVIRSGAGRLSVGVEIIGASPTLESNTIDARNRFIPPASLSTARTTTAIILENALGVNLHDNLFLTGEAENQYVLYCRGLAPVAPETISENLFAAFPSEGYFSNRIPRSVSCRGEFDFLAADGLELGSQAAPGNFDYPADRSYSDLINLETDRVIDPDYDAFGASR